MTPLGFAQRLAEDLRALPLPTPVHAQLGEIVVPCAGTWISVMNVLEVDPHGAGTGNCDRILIADLSVVAARDCANTANEDGSTNWVAQDAVSAQLDFDGELLWEQGEKWRADAWFRQGVPAIAFTIQGIVAMTTYGVQVPIP